MTAAFAIKPVTGVMGAEIEGVDLAAGLSGEEVALVRKALNEHQVLIFRDQPITPQQQHDFATKFGPVAHTKIDPGNSPVPGITVLNSVNTKHHADVWHTDHPYTEIPPMAGMLYALQIPSRGGDTMFASSFAAYDALSAPMRAFLEKLTADHSMEMLMRRYAAAGMDFKISEQPIVTHPIVRVHPETGRKGLYVSEPSLIRINELGEAESNAVLQFLYSHMKAPEFQMRVRWGVHTSVLWDERSTVHYAVPDYDEPRILHRLMVDGTRPFGVNALPKAA
jgi:taurine dioxygenase